MRPCWISRNAVPSATSSCTPHNHDQGCSPYGSKAERRARLHTALRLINPHEYAIAECMYGADSYLIACELDVTVQVIEDYKNWLHDSVAA